MDWRAPAAAPFYQATTARPSGLARRRHLTLHGTQVTEIEDELLDLNSDLPVFSQHSDGPLLGALNARRSGRMGDIVATIQQEQDAIIRADKPPTIVVQGGPGTGKTAVALHRAAYLLYSKRERLERSGVLIVGPGTAFMHYIGQVLPSLGETGVMLRSLGQLYPGVSVSHVDTPEVAALKGSSAMAQTLRRAVRLRQRLPRKTLHFKLDGVDITLGRDAVHHARERARDTHKPHNEARTSFVKMLLNQMADRYESGLRSRGHAITQEDRAGHIEDLRSDEDIQYALNVLWMPLTPQSLLRTLFSNAELLANSSSLPPAQVKQLLRPKNAPFTVSDVALLDELADLLGDLPRTQFRPSQNDEHETAYAQQVLDMMEGDGTVDAAMLAQHVRGREQSMSAIDRAEHDRTWAFGHIVVDEAQELTPMQWRMLERRCPSKSFTIVGDIAQTSRLRAPKSWNQALEQLTGGRHQVFELTVNYRTPEQILKEAAAMLHAYVPGMSVPASVRSGDHPVRKYTVTPAQTTLDALMESVTSDISDFEGGKVCVIAPADSVAGIAGEVGARLTAQGITVGLGSNALDATVAVMTADDSKGLEFDAVTIIDPLTLAKEHAQGPNQLYVAMTRSTQRLSLISDGSLPRGL